MSIQQPKWTSKKPTVPGWYWHKVIIWGSERTKMVELRTGLLGLYTSSMGSDVDMIDGQWAGPIEQPTEE